MGDCGNEPREKKLTDAYGYLGLHQMYPSALIPENVCDDKRFTRDRLYKGGKNYPHAGR